MAMAMEKILDENYYDLIIDNIMVPYYDIGNNITYLNERHSLLHVLAGQIDVCDLGANPYHRFPSIYTLTSEISLEKSGITEVQRNPALSLYGTGAIIGIIDTGIDYRHSAFKHNDGTTRILSIWDQTIQSGTPPEDMVYGSEYPKELINLALHSADPLSIVPTVDEDGHGTAIASVAAGKPDPAQNFSGVAPEAEFAVVKLKPAKYNLRNISFVPDNILCYQESDIMLATRYLLSVAKRLSRPIAICVALGSNAGSHDGQSAASSYFDYITRLSKICVAISAGNEGNSNRHYYGNVPQAPYHSEFELRVGNPDRLFSMEIWPYAPSRLSIEVTSPSGESTSLVYPRINTCERFSFVFNQGIIWINNINFEEETGEQLILLRFENPISGIWRFRLYNLENEPFSFHSWLPAGNVISSETYFLQSNPDTTILSPGNSIHSLTITAYNQDNDSILIDSSRGYSRTGHLKPDLAAPGYNLTCALPDNRYGTLTGTGAATAHTTGIIALLFEWAVSRGNYTSITGVDINHLLIRGAVRSPTTVYPNNIWGYGQININGVFERLAIF
jgi:subtilisin family serine protease